MIEEIATADVVTCAVGPNILKFIAEPIAKGIDARKKKEPIAVVACENAIGATDTLRGFIEQKLSDDSKTNIKDKARFANSAIDRIVPLQDEGQGMNVKIEKFYEWCVESEPFKPNDPPAIKGVHYVEDLQPYIERKLYTVNTGHATAAYYGYNKGLKYIHEVLEDKELHDIVQNVLKETAHLICTKHTHISKSEQEDYVKAIVKRISNPVLKDDVSRVGRAPLRKLSRKERFIGPAAHLAESDEKVDCLLGSVEMALRFQNVKGDEESEDLAKKLGSMDAKEVSSPARRHDFVQTRHAFSEHSLTCIVGHEGDHGPGGEPPALQARGGEGREGAGREEIGFQFGIGAGDMVAAGFETPQTMDGQ